MVIPGNVKQQYKTLYHDFTNTYTHLHEVSKELYATARKFVEKTEPEINTYLSKIAVSGMQTSVTNPTRDISKYMSSFDDFTIAANKTFGEINTAINQSEQLISQKLENQKQTDTKDDGNEAYYTTQTTTLSNLTATLQNAQAAADKLGKQLDMLTLQWSKIKQRNY